MDPIIGGKLLFRRIYQLGRIGRTPEGGVTRPGFSIKENKARTRVRRWMDEAGLETRLDSALNLIGTYPGKDRDVPAVITGSHLDSVPNGGRFDGVLGILGAIEAIRSFKMSRIENRRSIEVIAFAAEEPNIFGFSTFGSRAISGGLLKGVLERKDRQGRSLAELLARRGGRPEELSNARVDPARIATFIELHIEQGPILDIHKIPIGIVSTLCGIKRFQIAILGRPDHAGTTPMKLRKDAFVAGAEVALAIEGFCKSWGEEIVGTVGKVSIIPNQVNVVPGSAELEVDIRTNNREIFEKIDAEIMEICEVVARRRDLEISVQPLSSEPPVLLPKDLSCVVAEVCRSSQIS